MSTILAIVPIREEIKKARKKAKMTQGELAKACQRSGVPIEQSDISDYERGYKNPSMERIEAIAKALNKSWKLG